MDKADQAIAEFRRANRVTLQLPFKEVVRRHGNLDPIEVAPRLRNRHQAHKK